MTGNWHNYEAKYRLINGDDAWGHNPTFDAVEIQAMISAGALSAGNTFLNTHTGEIIEVVDYREEKCRKPRRGTLTTVRRNG